MLHIFVSLERFKHSWSSLHWQLSGRHGAAGLRGFAGGSAARVLQLAAGAAISWVTYEEVKLRLAGS